MFNKILGVVLQLVGIVALVWGTDIRPEWPEYITFIIGMLFIVQGNQMGILGRLDDEGR